MNIVRQMRVAGMFARTVGRVPAQPAMTSLVVGAKRIEQVEDAIAALEVRIPAEHFPKLDAICPPPWKQMDPIR